MPTRSMDEPIDCSRLSLGHVTNWKKTYNPLRAFGFGIVLFYILFFLVFFRGIVPGTSLDRTEDVLLIGFYLVTITIISFAFLYMVRFSLLYARLREGRLSALFPLDSATVLRCIERFLEGSGHRFTKASTTGPLPDERIWERMRLIHEVIRLEDGGVDITVNKTVKYAGSPTAAC